ncbi:LOW QUALITY PROTEIN: IQ and AAA domain-containing protein 1-like [Varanus komodoensis]|uniref:LOW QUALITY PROTEIN: IQ and AAA domain-containing protein 1-like n=1 Tax=Varanus komodoensis TaxID=61221 RepID=UPI001CF7B7B6|nr:LOW QUALITY PROTEIN: IQ and AAA domain-containing protein 1-like [Varanus komodoensis]
MPQGLASTSSEQLQIKRVSCYGHLGSCRTRAGEESKRWAVLQFTQPREPPRSEAAKVSARKLHTTLRSHEAQAARLLQLSRLAEHGALVGLRTSPSTAVPARDGGQWGQRVVFAIHERRCLPRLRASAHPCGNGVDGAWAHASGAGVLPSLRGQHCQRPVASCRKQPAPKPDACASDWLRRPLVAVPAPGARQGAAGPAQGCGGDRGHQGTSGRRLLRRTFSSHSTYGKLWRESRLALTELLAQELPGEPAKPERSRSVFYHTVATLFLRYVQTARRLEACYDQVVHPQKRILLRRLLDGVLGRILELKHELVELDVSEYHYMDHVLQELKLTPADMEVPIPKYFLSERAKVLQERKEVLAGLLDRPPRAAMPREEAVRLVQMAERMRQGRLRARFMWEIRRDEERERKVREGGLSKPNRELAATCIQKIWKGHVQRRLTKLARQMEMTFIGMELEPHRTGPSPAAIRAQLGEELRRMRQADHEAEYRDALLHVREALLEAEGPSRREALREQLRQWLIECHDLTGRFPDYPEKEIGGCEVLFAHKTPEEVRAELDLAEAKADAKKKEKKKEKEKGKKEAEKEADKKGKERKGEEDEGLTLSPSKFLVPLNQDFLQYTGCWSDQDEAINFEQRYEPELIKAEKRREVEAEIRLQVDELMREELRNLRLAVDLEETKAAKPPKGRKSAKQKKGKKGKKEKDLTPERTINSLYEELVLQGIIKKPQKVQLAEYSGDFCYLGTLLRQQAIEPTPSTLDVRQNVALYAVLPLGSPVVHELAPPVKSLLLAGPAGTGKKMLVHAVCTETGANLFDLSPDNLAGKYPGKSGLQMMVHLVFKVARLLQPSVIWVGNAEKTFYKKVPKDERELDPKRLKKDLPRALNLLRAEDRVLLMGTSSRPYLADLKGLCKTYTRILLLPRPDYASRYVTWQRLVQKHGGVVTGSLDLSALAKVSDGYSQGSMAQAVKAVLSERRLLQLPKRPLNANELLQMLAREDPIYPEEEEMLKEWYTRTPLGKRRLKEEEEKLKAAEAKDKKSKRNK